MGINTVAFTFFNAFVLRSLPVREPEAIVRLNSPVALGVAVGIGGGLAFAKLLSIALIGIKPFDPLTFACASGLMASVAALATWVPARRAARVDPMITFRRE
jgi:ABC-type lipoprotein release transport system permease subunit